MLAGLEVPVNEPGGGTASGDGDRRRGVTGFDGSAPRRRYDRRRGLDTRDVQRFRRGDTQRPERMTDEPQRCGWPGADPLYLEYHDREWGVPIRDERPLFELLCLEGAQAGLAWITVLRKRDGYRRAFAGFDPEVVARYDDSDVERLLVDPGIVRNRAKIRATIANARGVLELRSAGGFGEHLWSFVGGEPLVNRWSATGEIPASTSESEAMSRDLRKRGFGFVGPTICYAFMQSAGLVNDHEVGCFRWAEVQAGDIS
jgi:DNA-3-methyladenine glycosylase I